MKFSILLGYSYPSITSVQCLKVRTDIPSGNVGSLLSVSGADSFGSGYNGSSISFDNLLSQSNLSGRMSGDTSVFYPKDGSGNNVPGYAVQWDDNNVTFSVNLISGGYYILLDVEEDIEHIAFCRYFYLGSEHIVSPYNVYDVGSDAISNVNANDTGAPNGLGVAATSTLQVKFSSNNGELAPFYDGREDAIGICLTVIQYKAASNFTPSFWGFKLAEISKFICEFDGVSYDLAIDNTVNLDANSDQINSKYIYIPIPNKNPAGAIRVTAVMTTGDYYPWNQLLCQPMVIKESPDGIGNYLGNFVTARRSFGFTAAVNKLRWCIGFSPTYISPTFANDMATPGESTQSFIDQGILFETTDLDAVYSTPQIMQGAFHSAPQLIFATNVPHPGLGQLETGYTGVAAGCSSTDQFSNYPDTVAWPWWVNWQMGANYSTIDTKTELEKWLCPTCPPGKVLSGSCTWPFTMLNPGAFGEAPKLGEPICIINGTDFHNYSGWDATTTRDELWVVMPYNRTLKRWELHTGYGWEVINLMSIAWDGDEWLLATISILIDGTFASVAWKVAYDTSHTPATLTFEIWFKKSIDGGETWSTAVKTATVTAPFLARVVQSPLTGIMSIGTVQSKDGGATWA